MADCSIKEPRRMEESLGAAVEIAAVEIRCVRLSPYGHNQIRIGDICIAAPFFQRHKANGHRIYASVEVKASW